MGAGAGCGPLPQPPAHLTPCPSPHLAPALTQPQPPPCPSLGTIMNIHMHGRRMISTSIQISLCAMHPLHHCLRRSGTTRLYTSLVAGWGPARGHPPIPPTSPSAQPSPPPGQRLRRTPPAGTSVLASCAASAQTFAMSVRSSSVLGVAGLTLPVSRLELASLTLLHLRVGQLGASRSTVASHPAAGPPPHS